MLSFFRDVQKYFHGHHITINARSEDEVSIDDILDKVSKASASKFNFNGKKGFMTNIMMLGEKRKHGYGKREFNLMFQKSR